MSGPSNLFRDQFMGHGGPVVHCQCGRTHVAIESVDLVQEEGDTSVDEWLARAAEKPDAYVIHHSCDSCTAAPTGVGELADDCPCGRWEQYERAVLHDRDQLLKFFRQRAEKMVAEAAEHIAATEFAAQQGASCDA